MAANPAFQVAIDALTPVFVEQVKSANNLAAKVIAATSGVDEKVDAYISESDDEQVAKFREWLKAAQEKVAEIQAKIAENTAQIKVVAANAVANSDDVIDVDAVKAQFLEARAAAYATRKTLQNFMGSDEKEWDAYIEKNNITEVVSLAKGGKRVGATGIKRPRLASLSVDGVALDKPAFGVLAKELGLSTPDLQDAAFKAAGTDDLSTVTDQEFSFTVTDSKGAVRTVAFQSRKDEAVGAAAKSE